MKKKLLLFMAMVLACGVILAPKAAMAEDVASTETFTVNIPEATAWVLTPSGTAINPVSAHFNFTGRAVADIDGTNTIDFGNPALNTSYLITNADTATAANDHIITFTAAGDTNTIGITGGPGSALLTVADTGATPASVTLNVRRYNSTTDTELPQIGGVTPTVNNGAIGTGNLTFTGMTFTSHIAAISLLFDLNESTLNEDDAADTALGVNVVFTSYDVDE